MSTAALKDPELQEYYEALFLMFGTRGWTKLMEDVGRMHQTHDRLAGIETSEELWFRKGQINQMEWLLALRDASENAYKSILEEEGKEVESSVTNSGQAKIVGGPSAADED